MPRLLAAEAEPNFPGLEPPPDTLLMLPGTAIGGNSARSGVGVVCLQQLQTGAVFTSVHREADMMDTIHPRRSSTEAIRAQGRAA